MKKIFFVILVFIITVSIIAGYNNDPYAGKYKTSDNTILELNSADGSCKVINNFYKDVFYTYGKYTINHNKIEITFDNDKQNYLRVEGLEGEVKGSNIEFYNYLGEGKECTYYKVEG